MKSKLLLLSFLMLFTFTTNYAQSSAETSGIAVQGIARDINNTARANEDINLTFSIYYKVLDAAQPPIVSYTQLLTTDAFGVFSHVITNPYTNNAKFANYQMWLKIDEGGTIISDEKLKHVPYAIAANNGVPAGSIMPFVGEDAPAGWLLCDGVTEVPNTSPLYDLLGGTGTIITPNLGGMFLRGTGGSGDHVGPTLNTTQDDLAGPHIHPDDISISGNSGGSGNFSAIADIKRGGAPDFDDIVNNNTAIGILNSIISTTSDNNITSSGSVTVGVHSTTKTGGVQANSGVETRPVSYGVNYIIKL